MSARSVALATALVAVASGTLWLCSEVRTPAKPQPVKGLALRALLAESDSVADAGFVPWSTAVLTDNAVASGRVLSRDSGDPIEGARLRFDTGSSVTTDALGRWRQQTPFRIVAVEAGAYADFSDGGRHWVAVSEAVREIVLRLEPIAQELKRETSSSHILTGTVRPSGNTPVWVEAESLDSPSSVLARVVVDPAGRFRLALDRNEPMRLVAIRGNSVSVVRSSSSEGGVQLSFSEPKSLILDLGDDAYPGPTYLSLEWLGLKTTRLLHERIVFGRTRTFGFAGVTNGRYRVRGFRADGQSTALEVEIESEGDTEVAAQWRRGASMTGRVVDPRGAPIAGANVRLFRSELASLSPRPVQGYTGANGAFALTGIPEGEHAFVVDANGFEPAITERLESDGVHELRPLMIQVRSMAEPVAPSSTGVGIGVEFKPRVYELEVRQVMVGGGAQEAGLRSGDRVLAVEGQPVSEIGYRRALERIRGPAGTYVELELRPVGARTPGLIRVGRREGFLDRLR